MASDQQDASYGIRRVLGLYPPSQWAIARDVAPFAVKEFAKALKARARVNGSRRDRRGRNRPGVGGMAEIKQDALRERAERCWTEIGDAWNTAEPKAVIIERHLREVQRAAFEAGFYARPGDNWLQAELGIAPRKWEFSAGGSAADLKDSAYAAYLEQQISKEPKG